MEGNSTLAGSSRYLKAFSHKDLRIVKLNELMLNEAYELIRDGVLAIGREFSQFIDSKILEIEKYLHDSEDLNRELIGLI